MSRAETFERLRASLTPEQKEQAAGFLTFAQKLRLATLDGDTFAAYYASLSEEQRAHFATLMTDKQRAMVAELLGTPEGAKAEPAKQAAPAASPRKQREPSMEEIAAIAQALPSHLPKGDGGPWRIEQSTLDMFNSANATTYTLDAMPRDGLDVAMWLLRRIQSDLAQVGGWTWPRVVSGYLVGWHNPDPEKVARWAPLTQAILKHAQRLMHEPAGATVPPITIDIRKRRYSPWAAAAFFGGSFLTLLLLVGGKEHK